MVQGSWFMGLLRKKLNKNLSQNLPKEIDEMCGSGLDGEKLNQAHIIRYDIVRL